jgi:acetylornithine deacetylase/succinyl-diaminopimelate desuccinylase-like protein
MRASLTIASAFAATAALTTLAPASAEAQFSSADYPAPFQKKALEIFRHIIGIRSAEGHGKVPEVARYLADQFQQAGFPQQDIHVLPFRKRNGEESAGLVVRYRGDGSSGKKPILLVGHMDVVDALRNDWERDPFTLVEEHGYFFGRGTSDNKMGVTMLTTTFLRLKAEGFVPTRDLIIGFTGDEETGMISATELATTHRALTHAEFALNSDGGGGAMDPDGKPLLYLVQASEKTYATFELTASNPGGHSSTPRDDNAIYDVATALKHIQAYRFPVMMNDVTRAYLKVMAKVQSGEVGAAMVALADNPADARAAEVLWHAPEEVGITRTTCIATMLRAGHAENALPQSATATVNCRIFPGVAVEDVRKTLDSVAAVPGLRITALDDPKASPASPVRDDIMEAVSAAVHARYPELGVVPSQASYGTDGKAYRSAGIPTYGVAGLFMRDKDQFAHGLNERVEVRNFYAGLEHWKILVARLAGRPVT